MPKAPRIAREADSKLLTIVNFANNGECPKKRKMRGSVRQRLKGGFVWNESGVGAGIGSGAGVGERRRERNGEMAEDMNRIE